MLSLIVAHDENQVIGAQGRLPWRLSNDLRRFKRLTMGHAILMGRKTYESIGRRLPGRRIIVITRNRGFHGDDCQVVHDLQAALAMCSADDEPFVVGGAEIYRLALPYVTRLYLTRVHTRTEDGDIFFPELDLSQWQLMESTDYPPDERNEYATTFAIYQRPTVGG